MNLHPEEERDFCNRYLNRTEEPISYAMLRSLYGSVSKMTIATMRKTYYN